MPVLSTFGTHLEKRVQSTGDKNKHTGCVTGDVFVSRHGKRVLSLLEDGIVVWSNY